MLCPVGSCTSKKEFTSDNGLKGHLNKHLQGCERFKVWESEPRDKFLEDHNLTICRGCGRIAGNSEKNALKGMHRSCWNKVKAGEEETRGKEKTSKSPLVSPPSPNGHLAFPPIPQTAPEDGKVYSKFDSVNSSVSFMDIVQSTVRILHCVPATHEAEYDECADYALSVLLEDPTNPERWKPFLALPRAVLVNDGLTGKGKKRQRDSKFTARVKRFLEGEWEDLLHEAIEVSERGGRCTRVNRLITLWRRGGFE